MGREFPGWRKGAALVTRLTSRVPWNEGASRRLGTVPGGSRPRHTEDRQCLGWAGRAEGSSARQIFLWPPRCLPLALGHPLSGL